MARARARPGDGGSGDGEQLFEFADSVLSGLVQCDKVSLLARRELGLLAPQPALRELLARALEGR